MQVKTREKVKRLEDLTTKDVLVVYNDQTNKFLYERVKKIGQKIEQKGIDIEINTGTGNDTILKVKLPRSAKVLAASPGSTEVIWTEVKHLKDGDRLFKHIINMGSSSILSVEIIKAEQGKSPSTFYLYPSDFGMVVDNIIVKF
jgi:hypothetical protein